MHQTRNRITFFQRDVWISLSASFLVLWFSGPIIEMLVQRLSPSLSYISIYYIPVLISQAIPVAYLITRYGGIGFSDFTLKWSDVIVLFISLIIVFVYIGLLTLRGPYKPYTFGGEAISQLSGYSYYIFLLSVIILGPFLEEIFFRKYILEIFTSRITVVWAILLTSILESVLHFGYAGTIKDIVRLMPLFLTFVVLSAAYLKSRLVVTFVVHSLLNGLLLNLAWR